MASLFQDPKSGHFYAQFYDARCRPRRKTLSLKTKKKRTAERALLRLEERFALGDFDPWAPADEELPPADLSTLGPAVDAYLASCAHLKPKTIQSYKDVLLPFMRHLGVRYPVQRIDVECVLSWLSTTHAADVTRLKYVNHLGYLFRFLVRKGAMTSDVSKRVPLRRVAEHAPRAMTEVQVERLIHTIEEYSRTSRADFLWLTDIIRFNVHVGLRRGELLHLRWKHVDLQRRVLRVVNGDGFTTKSSRERTIPLSDVALHVLDRTHEGGAAEHVFRLNKKQINHNTLTHYFRKFRRMAGLPDGLNFHSTRHTFGTWLAERGTPVVIIQRLMGHSSIRTTERYMYVRADIAEEWIRRAFPASSSVN